MTDPVEDQFIEYTYTSYKIPSFTVSGTGTPSINLNYADAIAKKLYPGLSDTEASELPKVFGTIQNEDKAYIFGFIGKYVDNIVGEMYFVTIWYEGTTEGSKQQINCYKCNVGKANKCGFTIVANPQRNVYESGIDVWEDTFVAHLFGFNTKTVNDNEKTMFYLPKHSFFLEGDHQEFSGLPAGVYGSSSLVGN